MSRSAPRMLVAPAENGLRIASPPPSAGTPAVIFTRHASLDGHELASVRCLTVERGYLVECTVRRSGDGAGAPRELGPYAFERLDEAKRFVEETALALEYLGCEVDAERRAGTPTAD